MLGDGCGVDLQDLHAALLVGEGDFDLPVQTARAQESGVESIGAVGGHDQLGFAEIVEAIHLVEELRRERG